MARRASGRRAWGVDPALVSLIAGLAAPTDLLAALERSKAEGVNLAQAYLADFPDAEERLYRAVGRALEIKFVDWAPAAPGFDAGAVMQAGLCPLDGEGRLTLLLAPPAERLGALLSRNPRPPPGRAFMTTPSRFRDLVLSRLEARGQACDWLRGFDPELSVGPMGREAKLAVSLRLSLLVLACVLPQAPWFVSAWPFCAATAIKLFATASSASRSPQEHLQADQDLPIYSVLVPLYREARVVRQILESLSALDYPRAKLDVKILLEEDDDETRVEVHSRRLPPWIKALTIPQGALKTKARALNFGLMSARGSLLTVFDAEDCPDPMQLRQAAARFAAAGPSLACLQASLAVDNVSDSLLSGMFGLEYASLFDVVLPGLAALGMPLPLGGTSNHFRTGVLRRLGGWDAWNLTEDAELGLRLARYGYEVGVLDSTTYGEAPAGAAAWLRQRRRWIKGWIQTLVAHFRDPLRAIGDFGFWSALGVFCFMGAPIVGYLCAPAIVLRVIVALADGSAFRASDMTMLASLTSFWFLLCVGPASLLGTYALGMRRRGLSHLWRMLLALPAHSALMTLACWSAWYDLCRRPHYWSKTEHGLARSRRLRRMKPFQRGLAGEGSRGAVSGPFGSPLGPGPASG